MLLWTIRLLHLFLLRLISKAEAEQEVRKWACEFQGPALWGEAALNIKGNGAEWAAGGPDLAQKVQTAISEWETMPFETDPVVGQTNNVTKKSER